MFWLFGTRQEWPSRLRRLATGQKIWFVVLTLLAAIFALGPREAEARPRYRDKMVGMRLRLSGTYGWIDYDSISRASNGRTSFVSGPHIGRRGELEMWIPRMLRPWPLIGFIGDFETYPVSLFNRPIAYTDFGARVAWRVNGFNWNTSEFILSSGLTSQTFAEVRAFPRTQAFDLREPTVMGLKTEARLRFKLSQSHRAWRADIGAYFTMPLALYRSNSAELDKQQTRSFGVNIYLDRHITDFFDIGLGFTYQKNRLGYRTLEGPHPQSVEWNNVAPMITIQFWLAPNALWRD